MIVSVSVIIKIATSFPRQYTCPQGIIFTCERDFDEAKYRYSEALFQPPTSLLSATNMNPERAQENGQLSMINHQFLSFCPL